jgi:hypothetical protein
MTNDKASFKSFPWFLRTILFGSLAVVALLAGGIPRYARQDASPATPAWHSHEEAAADHGFVPSDPFPAQQRLKLMTLLGARCAHAEGYRGQGFKIAILDSGFRRYRSHLGADLPLHITCKSFRSDGNLEAKDSQHGILCGEVVHALAPDAELFFANWDSDRPDEFLDAVRWAKQQGVRLISCSVIMPSWSDGEGGGAFNNQLAQLLGEGEDRNDVLLFASAGNTAERHWKGEFQPGEDGLHEWRPKDTRNTVYPWGTDRVSVELYGQHVDQYELYVRDQATGNEVGHRFKKNPGARVVRFDPEAGASYFVQVRLKKGRPTPFHVVALGGNLAVTTCGGSICCPADNPAVLAVGAVDQEGHRQSYSSCGPNSAQPKPDLVAPVPFPSMWRSRPFSGTSAAAPQAAAIAALYWSAHADWTASRIRGSLRDSAWKLAAKTPDSETGYGRVAFPAPDKSSIAGLKTRP